MPATKRRGDVEDIAPLLRLSVVPAVVVSAGADVVAVGAAMVVAGVAEARAAARS